MSEPKFGEWQPIETAPKDGSLIMIGRLGWAMPARWRFYETLGSGYWVFSNNQHIKKTDSQPTHWMPLPEPPNAD